MQTFLPFADFKDSALVLDRQRLGKQRLEAKQIIMAWEGNLPNRRWLTHPAVKMWRDHLPVLALYGVVICMEWRRRGYTDTLLSFFSVRVPRHEFQVPWWIGWEPFHRSHQSNLTRKLPQHYQKFWPDVPDNLSYIWPTGEPNSELGVKFTTAAQLEELQ